jgi:DNA-binding NarL/FixJ family response regulator
VTGEIRVSDLEALGGVDAVRGDGIEALATSHHSLRDLAALLALPALWVDHEPTYIVAGLLGVLFGVLRLDCAYVRFDNPMGGPPLERWRPDEPGIPLALEPAFTTASSREQGVVTLSVATPDGAVRVTSMSPTLPGESGLVLVGARRTDFPTEYELHLLRVAVGQATIAIHTARRLADERAARLAAEAALRLRDRFLATLAQDLEAPLTTLLERVTQAHALATEGGEASALVSPDALEDNSETSRPDGGSALPASPARLSRREAEVLGLLAQGLSNKEIAGILWLSERTVERHITSLYRKIGVERRSEATAFALRHSLVEADKG